MPPRYRISEGLLAAAAFLALALVATYPLALSWRTALPAGAGDLWQNYWNFWWWKQCLLQGTQPLHSPLLFHPTGTDLIFHTHSPLNQALAMPVNLLFGQAAAYNFCLIFALTLTGLGTYLLAREITGDRPSALIAGLVFATFPNLVEQTLEHLNLFSVQFIPFALLYLVRWASSHQRSDALRLGTCFGLTALCGWHLGLKLALVCAPALAWICWRQRPAVGSLVRQGGWAAGLALLIVLPFLLPLVGAIVGGAEYQVKPPVHRGIDASFLLTPPYGNPLFAGAVADRYLDRAYHAAGFVCYLGFLPLGLAALGTWRRWRQAWPWLVLFASGLVLALGTDPYWDGARLEVGFLPFALLREIPLLESLRVANRFMLVAGLGLAVLAGLGWSSLRGVPWWTTALAAVLIFAEYSWLPFPVRTVNQSPLLANLSGGSGAVLDIPFHQRSRTVHNMAAQTVHGRPIGGGYLATYPPAVERRIAEEPALATLAGVPPPDAKVDVARLRELGFRAVVIHKYRADSFGQTSQREADPSDILEWKRVRILGGIPDATIAAIRKQLDAALGGAASEDRLIAVYLL
ncbi:MAG: glycosyltransferase family 39 protein [Bryobacterales bacterium]|nr:glycosyltransferase family 39 protein [Bryobacterales bacterium]